VSSSGERPGAQVPGLGLLRKTGMEGKAEGLVEWQMALPRGRVCRSAIEDCSDITWLVPVEARRLTTMADILAAGPDMSNGRGRQESFTLPQART